MARTPVTHAEEMGRTFDVTRVSPSRIGAYADCGEKFRFKYIEGVAPERYGSAALFGKVMHNAREHWVMDRKRDLIELVRRAWVEETKDEPSVAAFIQQYAKLSGEAIRLCEQIKRARPEIVNPRMTKDFKSSEVAKRIGKLLGVWLARLNASKYDFSERDPLPGLYDESLTLAWKYGDKWCGLPNALHTEFAFEVEWHGFILNGFIDDISQLVDKDTGEMLGYGIFDAKTYRYSPEHSGKDSRQLCIYGIAVRDLVSRGALDLDLEKYQLYAAVDRMRLLDRKFYDIGDDAERALLRELLAYKRGVENDVYIPATKTCASQFCDFRDACIFNHGTGGKEVELNVAA